MKTINVTDEEQAELRKLRAKKTAKATSTESSDVVRAAGTSEGAKEGWTHRINFHSNPDRREFLKKTRHIESVDGELEGIGSMLANKETAELAKSSPHTYKVEELAKASAKASDTTNTEVIHCRSHSASGPVLAADKPWVAGERVEIMWMPSGVSTICAGFRKGSIELTVNCNEATADAVQASLESWRAERPKQECFGCIEHQEREASFRVGASCGFKWNDDGVYLAAEPTTLGAQNVNGRVHRSWSPSFTTDADYSKATERNGVLMFPEGVRGSRSNPAQITGVDFCVGTLTNKPAFHSMSPVKASDAVQAQGNSEGAKKGWEHRAGLSHEAFKSGAEALELPTTSAHMKAHEAHKAAAEAAKGEDENSSKHHEQLAMRHRAAAIGLSSRASSRAFTATKNAEDEKHQGTSIHKGLHASAAEAHEEAAHQARRAGDEIGWQMHTNHSNKHKQHLGIKATDTTSSSITAHCAATLKQDVPDATPAEVACYEKCLEDGGSHTRAVEEIRKQRNPAAKASLEEIYDKVTAAWSPQARAAAAAARKNHKGLSPEHKKIAEGVAESSDHANADDFYHSVNEAGVWKDSGIPSHLHSEALDHATAHFEKINATNTTTPDTILARQASVLEQANAIATEHGVARTTLDDVYSKCAVTATGTSEGAKKGWEHRYDSPSDARWDALEKTTWSNIASNQAKTPRDHAIAVLNHERAADAHNDAMQAHLEKGSKAIAEEHEKSYLGHIEAARNHRKESKGYKIEEVKATDATPQDILNKIYARAETVSAGAPIGNKNAAGQHARNLTEKASRASEASHRETSVENESSAQKAHERAAEAHQKALNEADSDGEKNTHIAAITFHQKKAGRHEMNAKASDQSQSATLQSIYARAGETA